MPGEKGSLRIRAERLGTVPEVTQMLNDLDRAYFALYRLDATSPLSLRRPRRVPVEFLWEYGIPFLGLGEGNTLREPGDILPSEQLVISRVRIESPGFWEVLGALNPLQQLREYLKDRHERRQDREWREAGARAKQELENELIRRQLFERDNSLLNERIRLLRDLGFSNEEIQQLVWASTGKPLSQLGRHQDTNLLGPPE